MTDIAINFVRMISNQFYAIETRWKKFFYVHFGCAFTKISSQVGAKSIFMNQQEKPVGIFISQRKLLSLSM